MSESKEVERKVKAIYSSLTTDLINKLDRSDYPFGYKILNAPPLWKPKILFIGFQPGGGASEWENDEKPNETHLRWPREAEYAVKRWRLARHLKTIFATDYLHKCVGTNANFIRWPCVNDRKSKKSITYGYRSVLSSKAQERIRVFSTKKVLELIEIMNPEHIIAIGLSVLAEFQCSRLRGETFGKTKGGRVIRLTAEGRIANKDVLAVTHLCIPINNCNRSLMSKTMRQWVGLPEIKWPLLDVTR